MHASLFMSPVWCTQVLLAAWIWFIGLIGETPVRYGIMLVGIGFTGVILCQYPCAPARPWLYAASHFSVP